MQSKTATATKVSRWFAGAVMAAALCFIAPRPAQAQVGFGVHVGYGAPIAAGYYGDPNFAFQHRAWERQRWEAAQAAQWRHDQWLRSQQWRHQDWHGAPSNHGWDRRY
ncbi:hypothetical protein [Acidipila sp. EB88]|uniref:hypothetical protein n=1 Tax=Acidipila sp. EB88 TaxID=2305226 RepID=UPI000F5EDFA5|nr:hypothetical protein [Acidipila sp. EB88]RRA47554.1 hypothetical protein D1Y84_03820 [Acidipila sp. EB88]